MNKLSFAVAWCALITFHTGQALAQDTASPPEASAAGAPKGQAPSNPSVPANSNAQSDPCGPRDSSDLVYPMVEASYVGGTVPKIHMTRQPPFPFSKAPFILSQYRANGKITAGQGCLLFVFKPSKKNPPSKISGNQYHYQVLPCNSESEFLSSEAKKACNPDNKPKMPDSYVIQIPYRNVNVLSRAKYASAELSSVSGPYVTASAAVVTAILSAVHNTHAKELAGGITAGSLVLFYWQFVAKPRLQDNYIAVFVCKEVQQPCEKQPANPASNELFAQGDVIMFRVPNKHDYYNISMILNGETGKTFVSETAEKTAK